MAIDSTTHIPVSIETALKKAAAITGVDFQYLVDTAKRESGFRPAVKAPTSSASGLFQFIESTWLQMVKEKGPELGLGDVAKHIVKDAKGRYRVPDAEIRRDILALRNKPEVAALMAGAFTQQNAASLESTIGRKPTAGELYIAHFLGAHNGGKLIKAASVKPEMQAAALFPGAASSNKSLFYRRGQAVSVKGLYQNLVRRHHAQNVVADQSLKVQQVQKSPVVKQLTELASIEKSSPIKEAKGLARNEIVLQTKSVDGDVKKVADAGYVAPQPGGKIADVSEGQIFREGVFFEGHQTGALKTASGANALRDASSIASSEALKETSSVKGQAVLPDGFFKAQAEALLESRKLDSKKLESKKINTSLPLQKDIASSSQRGDAGSIGVWGQGKGSFDVALRSGEAHHGAAHHGSAFNGSPSENSGPILETGQGRARGLFQKGGLGLLKG